MVLGGQVSQRFRVAEMFMFHDKVHRVSRFTATEAFINAACGRYIKGRSFLVVKRTQSKEVGTASFERDKITDHLLDTGGVNNYIYGFFLYQGWGKRETNLPKRLMGTGILAAIF